MTKGEDAPVLGGSHGTDRRRVLITGLGAVAAVAAGISQWGAGRAAAQGVTTPAAERSRRVEGSFEHSGVIDHDKPGRSPDYA